MDKNAIKNDKFKYYRVIAKLGGDNMAELPIAPVGRILKNAGAERVSEDAVNTLAKFLEEKGEEISREAVKVAKHAGRKTVKAADIEMSV
jgi:histone H3/H4